MKSYLSHLLAIGAHPDDVEIGCGGVLYKTSKQGKHNIIIDLSPSQLSTHGSPEQRIQESQDAAQVVGVQERINCKMQDGNIIDSPENRICLVEKIRTYKPEIILFPWTKDRHPDHENTAQLVKNSVFFAGLSKYPNSTLPPHKPRLLLHYMIRHDIEPDIIVTLDEEAYQAKMKAFQTYTSQQNTNARGFRHIEARHIFHGTQVGSPYGEGFKLYSHGIGVEDFDGVKSGFF